MPQINCTKKELIDLNNALHSVGDLKGPRFAYVIARNLSIIKDEIHALQQATKIDDAFMEFEKDRVALAEKYAVRDENGSPKRYVDGGLERFVIGDQVAFDKELEDLKIKHKDALDSRVEQDKAFSAMLEDKVEFFLYELKKEDLPADISAQQMTALVALLAEEE